MPNWNMQIQDLQMMSFEASRTIGHWNEVAKADRNIYGEITWGIEDEDFNIEDCPQ